MSTTVSTSGYSMAPMKDGSPHAQALANGNASIQAASIRNAAGGRKKRKRKYRGGEAGLQTATAVDNPSNYPTLYSPVTTQQKLLTASVANNVNSQGDLPKGGSKRSKKSKKSKRSKKSKKSKKSNFFNNLFSFTMKKRK